MTSPPLRSALLFAAVLLGGCGGVTASGFGAPPQVLTPATERSWISPEATTLKSLLYVANVTKIFVFSYDGGKTIKLVGSLTGFKGVGPICADRSGNIWVPDTVEKTLYEFAHGATTPTQSLRNKDGYPFACAADPGSGDVAVTESHPNGKYAEGATVRVYPGGKTPSRAYSTSNGFRNTYYLTYDGSGDLFVDAVPCGYYACEYGSDGGAPGLYVLPDGGDRFEPITVRGAKINDPTGLAWINPTLLAADDEFNGRKSGAYKLLVSGSTAKVKSQFEFAGVSSVNAVTHRTSTLIVPDIAKNVVDFFSLSDGSLISSFKPGLSGPFSAVISQVWKK